MMTINESLEEKFLRAGDFPPAGFMQGANMAFRRQVLVDINGFDDSLGAGKPFGAEDVDAAVRALAHGWTAKYDPRPVVYHHHRRKPGNDAMQLSRAYYVDRGGYYMKCILFMPQRWRCIKFWLWTARHQALGITLREVGGAIRYLFYQCGQKPNRSY
jgi:GT2 family glycosyltransferase